MKNCNNTIEKMKSNNQIEERLIDAFMTLYESNVIEKISIKMLTELAGLNRGTFYLHYHDIYDLLNQIETKFHKISRSIAINTVDALFNNTALDNALPSIEFYESNLKYYKILICIKGKSNLEQIMKSEIKKAFISKYHINDSDANKLNEYALEYISSAQVAVIIHWLRKDMEAPLCDISNLIQVLASNGALKFFE